MYGSLPNSEQIKVFRHAPKGMRKAVIATNIAETSVTIPGIVYGIFSIFSTNTQLIKRKYEYIYIKLNTQISYYYFVSSCWLWLHENAMVQCIISHWYLSSCSNFTSRCWTKGRPCWKGKTWQSLQVQTLFTICIHYDSLINKIVRKTSRGLSKHIFIIEALPWVGSKSKTISFQVFWSRTCKNT